MSFEYIATHFGKETDKYYASEYMVNIDGEIVGYKILKDGTWKEANSSKFPFQIFPKVSELKKII